MNHILALLLIFASQDAQAQARATAQAHVGKGYEFEKDDRFASAAAEFEAALAADPELSRARYQLAVCYFALGRQDDARREFARLRTETHADPSVVYFIGRLDLLEHDLDGAIRELRSVAAQPPFPDTAYYLGSAYLEKGSLQSAEEWLKRALPLNPRDFRIPDHLARIYQREGHSAEAEKEYAQSAKLRQNYNQAGEDGVTCSEALEKGEAEAARQACAKLDQLGDPDRLTVLGMIYGRHGHYAEAVEPLRRAAALDPDSYEIEHNLGLTYFRLKLYQEARQPLERAVALRPDFFDSNALLGATLFALRQDSLAYRVLDHAHRLNPEDGDTRELLFKTATLLGAKSHEAKSYAAALKYLQAAEELKPQDPQVHARLAIVYGEAGDPRRADAEKRTAERLAAPP
ncbi:MAG TPA: tetratricopeptide repeat protein [Terriglobia bacterium]|nr:tetratricopeptide repeat protein [Terriglobia bacterium]